MSSSWQKLVGVSAFQIWELLTLGFTSTNLLSCFNFFLCFPFYIDFLGHLCLFNVLLS
jgi:hypothetical protein